LQGTSKFTQIGIFGLKNIPSGNHGAVQRFSAEIQISGSQKVDIFD
jgi:hypothetical protein